MSLIFCIRRVQVQSASVEHTCLLAHRMVLQASLHSVYLICARILLHQGRHLLVISATIWHKKAYKNRCQLWPIIYPSSVPSKHSFVVDLRRPFGWGLMGYDVHFDQVREDGSLGNRPEFPEYPARRLHLHFTSPHNHQSSSAIWTTTTNSRGLHYGSYVSLHHSDRPLAAEKAYLHVSEESSQVCCLSSTAFASCIRLKTQYGGRP